MCCCLSRHKDNSQKQLPQPKSKRTKQPTTKDTAKPNPSEVVVLSNQSTTTTRKNKPNQKNKQTPYKKTAIKLRKVRIGTTSTDIGNIVMIFSV